MTIGPKKISYWACVGCDYMVRVRGNLQYRCESPDVTIDDRTLRSDVFDQIFRVPTWCPYARMAIMQHVVDES